MPAHTRRATSRAQARTPDAARLFEPLEKRIVLSDTYYAWVGVEELPGYAAEYGEPATIVGASDNGRYLWSWPAANRGGPDEPYIVADGEVRYLRDTPELADAELGGISSDGTVLARDIEGADLGRTFLLDLSGGGRTYLDELALDAPADFELAAAEPLAITDGGGVLLATAKSGSGPHTLWIITDRVVTRLWSGSMRDDDYQPRLLFTDANASDTVVGYAGDSPMLWSPQTGLMNLAGRGLREVGSVNDDGTVFAKAGERIVLWRNGQMFDTGYGDEWVSYFGGTLRYPLSRDATGRMVILEISGGYTVSSTLSVVVTPDGPENVRIDPHLQADRMSITEGGLILDPGRGYRKPGGFYSPVSKEEFFAADPGGSAAVWTPDGTVQISAPLADGAEGRFLSSTGAGWTLDWDPVEWLGLESPLARDVMVDARTGRALLLTETDRRILVQGDPELVQLLALLTVRADHAPTGFFDHRGLPVAAGMNESGDLQLVYVSRRGGRDRGIAVDLSSTHLDERGLPTPAFAGPLDSYITPWGGMSIVGLDADGELHAVWWSPGLHSALWTTSSLTEITGAPRLVGSIIASVTPWNGQQIMGTDERGHVISIWWSPKSGGWRWTDLTALTTGAPVEPGSIAAGATAWGAIELVGRTTANEVVTYWWTPATRVWRFESITAEQAGAVARIAGPISMVVGRDGSQHITGVSADGHVIHLFWLANGHDLWRAEDLTQLAMS